MPEPTAVTFSARETAVLCPAPPDPEPLGPDEVRGETRCTLISAGTELAGIYLGKTFPRVPGYAAAFVVTDVGSEVTGFKRGDLAFCMGPHRSWQRVAENRAVLVPPGVSPEQAPFARLMGVSMTTLSTTRARPPERVLVSGLGLVGHLAAQNFAACGFAVTGVDPDLRRREFAAANGIAVMERAPQEFTGPGEKFSLALECSGHEAGALDACRALQKDGEIALIGCPWTRKTDHTAHELLSLVFHNYLIIRSGWEWELPLDAQEFRRTCIFENYAAALRWLADGRVRVDDLYTLASPVDCQAVYQDLLHSRAKKLGVVFDWESESGIAK